MTERAKVYYEADFQLWQEHAEREGTLCRALEQALECRENLYTLQQVEDCKVRIQRHKASEAEWRAKLRLHRGY